MSSAISNYRTCLAATVNENTLNEANWRSESWKKAYEGLNQEILNDAFNQHGLIKEIFSELGEIEARKLKSQARVEKKMTEQAPGRENFFKVVSDFAAVRIYCNVTEIPGKIDRLRELVIANGGQIHVRGSSTERPYGLCLDKDKKFTDITQYAYVFIEKIGYPVEFQIGHKFAAHTFTIDSALRDNKECGLVDLWNKNFYGDVKKHILDKANGEQSQGKEAIQAKAVDLHPAGVPAALQEILNKI